MFQYSYLVTFLFCVSSFYFVRVIQLYIVIQFVKHITHSQLHKKRSSLNTYLPTYYVHYAKQIDFIKWFMANRRMRNGSHG